MNFKKGKTIDKMSYISQMFIFALNTHKYTKKYKKQHWNC